jgi:uncharacterized alpha-E superfamily protein
MSGWEVPTRTTHLLSRYAESINWLARYMERIENLARIIDVTESFMRTGGNEQGWHSIVQINADEKRFFKFHDQATPDNVIDFYVLDRNNPTSIVRMITAARENARTLRPLISTEMWSHINMFYNRVRALEPGDIETSRVAELCSFLRRECQTHTGITEGTFYRDQGWCFYALGKHLERADQITRLVDIKYHTLLPVGAPVGSPVDISQWNTVLRAASAYHAFRRTTSAAMTPASVAGFILLSEGFPRSLPTCVRVLHAQLTQLRSEYGLRASAGPLERIDEILAALANQSISEILVRGLHEFLDWMQIEFIGLQQDIAAAYWAGTPSPPE